MSKIVFFVGNTDFSEFAQVISLLTAGLAKTDSRILQQQEISHETRFAEASADFFVLFQSYPAQFSISDIVFLKKNYQFSPILLIAGCCCEGAVRTAPPLPGVFRFYTFQADAQLAAEVSSFLTSGKSLFSLPQPVSDEEIIQYLNKKRTNRNTTGGTVKLCCIVNRFGPLGNDSAMNDFLGDLYRRQDFTILSDLNELPADFGGKIVADADDSPFLQILESFQRIRGHFADSDITGYINSPRINEKTALCNAGVNRVLHKLQ
ncbi:MAG: hypothetical protein FWE67_02050 [Planctomycetaceae bacterium]|nr:hypothetical protein [Planctomycetaceae bacterium]